MRASRFFHRLMSVLIAVTVLAGAQEPVKPKLNPRIVTATRQVSMFSDLEIQMLKAVQKKDKAALQAMLTDDCVIEMPNADRLPGDEWVDSVMAKDFTLKSFAMRNVFAVDLGNAAVVKFERATGCHSTKARLRAASFLSWTYGRKMATRGSWPTALSPRRTPSPRYLKPQLNQPGSNKPFS